jgi:hypothetical protein
MAMMMATAAAKTFRHRSHNPPAKMSGLVGSEDWKQGCQIFLGTIYQSGEKYTKSPNACKKYLMVVKYYKIPNI